MLIYHYNNKLDRQGRTDVKMVRIIAFAFRAILKAFLARLASDVLLYSESPRRDLYIYNVQIFIDIQ